MTFDKTTVLRLEVENTPTGLVNLVKNPPDATKTGWGWSANVARFTRYQVVSGNKWLAYTTASGVANYIYTEDWAQVAGEYAAARLVDASPGGGGYTRFYFEWIDATGAVLFTSAASTTTLATDVALGGTVRTLAAQLAPANTVRGRLRVNFYSTAGGAVPGIDLHYLREVTVAKASTAAPLTGLGYISADGTFTNVLGPTHTISVRRDELNVGTLTAEILDATLDPSQSTLVRPGKRCRLMALDTTQTITINGTPTGGTFALAVTGHSATLAWNAASSAVQTAVRAWGGLFAAVTVTGSAGGPYTVVFPNGPAGPFTVDQTGLTGGTASASQATIAAWTPIYTGKVSRGETVYDPTRTDAKKARVTLTAVDGVTQLSQVKRSNGVALLEHMWNVLPGSGVPYILSTYSGPADYITSDDNATALDQVAITRDSTLGYAWMDKANVLQLWLRADIGTTPVNTLNESKYSDLNIDYDTDRCINAVTVKIRRVNLANGQTVEVTYGPFVDQTSIDTWGTHAAEFTVQGITDSSAAAAAYAAPILAANATPAVRINSVRLPIGSAADVIASKALLDLYDMVTVANTNAAISTNMRVTGITHTITPDKWLMDLDFTVSGSVAAPQAVPALANPAAAGVEQYGGATLSLTGGWPNTAPGPTSGFAMVLPAGVLRAVVGATAYVGSASNVTVDVYFDQVNVGTMRLNAANPATNAHSRLSDVAFTQTVTAGTHYVYLRAVFAVANDAGDFGSFMGVVTPA